MFEPNDEPLGSRVRRPVTRFLFTQWRLGAPGRNRQEGVRRRPRPLDDTQDDIDDGRLICEVGIAPVKPAEFVIFRIQQKTARTSRPC